MEKILNIILCIIIIHFNLINVALKHNFKWIIVAVFDGDSVSMKINASVYINYSRTKYCNNRYIYEFRVYIESESVTNKDLSSQKVAC